MTRNKISIDSIRLYHYISGNMEEGEARVLGTGSKADMKKTTIELSEEQYFFLKEKALELQKQNQNSSIVSIIRDLIERDRQDWTKEKKAKRG